MGHFARGALVAERKASKAALCLHRPIDFTGPKFHELGLKKTCAISVPTLRITKRLHIRSIRFLGKPTLATVVYHILNIYLPKCLSKLKPGLLP